MASKVQVVLVDDIDGGEADRTVSFAIDGAEYEIDLSAANAESFLDVLSPYIAAARKTSRGRGVRRKAGSDGAGSVSSAQVRAWAAENGIEVSSRGRVPADVVAKYQASRN